MRIMVLVSWDSIDYSSATWFLKCMVRDVTIIISVAIYVCGGEDLVLHGAMDANTEDQGNTIKN